MEFVQESQLNSFVPLKILIKIGGVNIKKIIAITIVGIITISGLSVVAMPNSEMEFWGVVVVNVDQTLEPYIYDALLTAGNWDKDHLILLWKEEATKSAILASIDWLKDNADENDIVLFAGDIHGSYNEEGYGIFPFDGRSEGIILVADLDRKFDEIKAMSMCLIFDCCFSGNFVDDLDLSSNQRKLLSFKRSEEGRKVFIDGLEDDNRVVIMSSLKNGLTGHWYDTLNPSKEISFSSCFAKALINRADMNDDMISSAEEAFEYAKNEWMPLALRLFFNIPLQIIMWLAYRSIFKPFPNMNDPSPEELPIIIEHFS